MDKNFQKALELFKENKVRSAIPLFERVIDINPDNIEARYKFGICLFRIKEFLNSEQVFRDVISFDHQYFRAWYYLGLSLERQNRLQEARNAFKISLVLNPELSAAKNKLEKVKEIENDTLIGSGLPSNMNPNEGPGKILYSAKRRRLSSCPNEIFILTLSTIFFLIILESLQGRYIIEEATIIILISTGFVAIFTLIIWLLRSSNTKYIIYERRIDFKKGILFKRHKSVWLYEIKNLKFYRTPWFLLTRNAAITIETEIENFKLVGLPPPKDKGIKSPVKFVQNLFETLRNTVRTQRGEIKKVWI